MPSSHKERQETPSKYVKVKVGKRWILEAEMTEETTENVTTYDVKSVKIAGILITVTTMTLTFWALQYAADLFDFIKSLYTNGWFDF